MAIILGIILIVLLRKKFAKQRLLKWAFRLTLLVVPFTLYFIYAPIYQGDFSNNVVEVERIDSYAELTGEKLVVISMPNCPFCYLTIDRVLKLKERVPEAEIEYVVCSSILDQGYIDWFQEKGGDKITVRFADSSAALTHLAEGAFPTFILVDGNKPLKKWSNDGFGAAAMDEVELSLH